MLHKKDVYNKLALVCMYADKPLTSGQVTKVLNALDVKADQGQISNMIKKNSGKFTASAARKKGGVIRPKYKLTSHARSDFETFLNGKS